MRWPTAWTGQGSTRPRTGWSGSRLSYAMSAFCHRLPNFNLVYPHPLLGAGFPRTVCNKARAYLDCLAPCPSFRPLLCLPPCLGTMQSWSWDEKATDTLPFLTTIITCPSLPEIVWSCLLFLFIVTVDPDIIHDLKTLRCCVCVCPLL